LSSVAALIVVAGCLASCSSGSGNGAGAAITLAGHQAATRTAGHHLTLDPSHDYGNEYADGLLPVGDGRYRTAGAKKGYVYACATYAQALSRGGGGAQERGPWFTDDNSKYDINKKSHVQGRVHWDSEHSFTTEHGKRKVATNDLPTHTSGVFPVDSSDPAYQYDRNPNQISAQSISLELPKNPKYGSPRCMGGVVGVMKTGVMLFSALDAGGRDAGAWEVQDNCDAHPQMSGTYHYHSLSTCIKKVSVHHVIGWALDGFPITGPQVHGSTNVLTTRNLDVCHGITSKVKIAGEPVTTYHYVMTEDYPYSLSCFRGTPVTTGPVG
jgi:hypothetical protein